MTGERKHNTLLRGPRVAAILVLRTKWKLGVDVEDFKALQKDLREHSVRQAPADSLGPWPTRECPILILPLTSYKSQINPPDMWKIGHNQTVQLEEKS